MVTPRPRPPAVLTWADQPDVGEDSPNTRASRYSSAGRTLKNLASLLNSPSLRDVRPLKDTASKKKRRGSRDMIEQLVHNDANISMDELTFIRELGAGGFATVALYRYLPKKLSSESMSESSSAIGASRNGQHVALKLMRRQFPDPRHGPPGLSVFDGAEPRMIDVPDSWRVTFQSEALVLKALRHPNVVACTHSLRGPNASVSCFNAILSSHPPARKAQATGASHLAHQAMAACSKARRPARAAGTRRTT